ncbi:MAG: N-acetyltransferase [Candidatus Latescibacteria bacterium]|nr:N-acetyltransferase [Candidatus Latescibacterota bacterium]
MSIHSSAQIGDNVEIGLFTVIEANVIIGVGCNIGHHAVIHAGTMVGNGVRIDDHAVIGKKPVAARRSKTTEAGRELEPLVIGENCIIGTGAIVYAGAILGKGVLVADTASVREDVTIGDYTIIGRNVTIENKVTVGARCKVMTDAYICAFSEIGDDCFIAPCVATSNDNYAGRWKERTKYYKGVTVRNGGRLGVNVTTLPGRVIGQDGMAGAGAVVTRDVPDATIVCGNPGKTHRPVPENQLLKNQDD